jgi:hypothetical protein
MKLLPILFALSACTSHTLAPVPPSACHPALACDTTLSSGAQADVDWMSLECPAGVDPDYPAITTGGNIYGCLGEWIGDYTSEAPWHWCCPVGVR